MGAQTHRVEHLGLDLQLHLVLLQSGTVDQEGVLDALAESRDLGQLQVDVVAGEDARDRVEQPERSLAETASSQRWARSSGRSVTRGVTGND